jgi:type VI secretion system secreted protein Hcp
MKYGTVKGNVTEEGHKDWIQLSSFQWGVGRGISSPTGHSSNRESSAPSVSEITVSKATDVATDGLLDAALQGEGVKVEIDFCKTEKGKLEVYLKYDLEDCMISGYSISSGGDMPSESISLNFTKIETAFTAELASGKAGEKKRIIYDIGKAKVGGA